jgi:hypothetical protein
VDEKRLLTAFLDSHVAVVAQKAADGSLSLALPVDWKPGAGFDPIRAAAFVDLVDTVVNTNDFIYRF